MIFVDEEEDFDNLMMLIMEKINGMVLYSYVNMYFVEFYFYMWILRDVIISFDFMDILGVWCFVVCVS